MNVIIGFSCPNKFMIGAELIKLWQGGTKYCHVYMVTYSPYTELFLVHQASHGMVNCMSYDAFKESNNVVREFTVNIAPEDLQATVKKAQELLGRPYGVLGLCKLVVARLLQHLFPKWCNHIGDGLKTLHCSEFIGALFPKFAAKQPNLDRIEPVDIYKVLEQA